MDEERKRLLLWIEDFTAYLEKTEPPVFLEQGQGLLPGPFRKESSVKKTLKLQVPKQAEPHPPAAKKEPAAHPSPKARQKDPSPKDTFADVKATMKKWNLGPILEEIPCDLLAKKKQQAYLHSGNFKTITILRAHEQGAEKRFLEDLTFAIETYFAPAKLACYTEDWDLPELVTKSGCKYFIAQKSSLFSCSKLLPFYQENGDQSRTSLGGVPILFLEDLSSYFQEPAKKRSLWNELQTTLPHL